MDTAARRAAISETLRTAEKPVSASALARRYQVSRQIIVGDIALLRAAGYAQLPDTGSRLQLWKRP